MFTFLVVAAWTLVIFAAILLLVLASLPFIGSLIFSNNFMLKVSSWLTNQPFSLPFLRVVTVSGPEEYLAEGPFNSWVLTPIGIINAAAGGEFQEAALSALSVYTLVGVFAVIAFALIGIAISELVRLRRRQKISKPFIKIILVLFPVLGLLYGQTIVLIASVLLLTSLLLLEGVLLDPESVNNYAEERNLITIHHEEKKFEKEVAKEGKLIGNIDLVKVEKEQDVLNQSEEKEQNSNSMLSEGSTKQKLKYEMLIEKKAILSDKREELKNTINDLKNSERINRIQDYNDKVQEINKIISILDLNEKELFWEDLEVEDSDKTSDLELKKIKLTKEYSKWKKNFDMLAIKKIELEIKDSSNKKRLKKIINFNSKCIELNDFAKSIGLKKDHYLLPINLEVETHTDNNDKINENINSATFNDINKTNFDDEALNIKASEESLEKISIEKNNETFLKNLDINLNEEDIFQTTDVETIYRDQNFTQVNLNSEMDSAQSKTLNSDIKTTVISEIVKTAPLLVDKNAHDVNSSSNNVTKDNTINSEFNEPEQFEKNESYSNEGLDKIHNQTLSTIEEANNILINYKDSDEILTETNVEMTREEVDEQIKNRMELAINMDLSDLKVTNQIVNADKNSIYNDIHFVQEQSVEKDETNYVPEIRQDNVENDEIILKPFEAKESKNDLIHNNLHSQINEKDIASLREELEKIELRMSNLENIIESMSEKNSTLFQNEFDSLNQKIANISKTIEEIKEASSPRTIIEKLTKKHIYNQK